MTDVLLLDYNGVVVNDEPLHFAAFRDVLAGYGLPLDEPTYYAVYLGMNDRLAFVEAWRRAHRTITGELLRILIEDKAGRYAALTAQGAPLVPGAQAFVRAAAERWRIAIVSGALRREIDAGLAQAGLQGAVAAIVASEDVETSKPDPACYSLALERLSSRARVRRAVAVEDSAPGLDAARAVGAGSVALTTSRPPDAFAGADLVWRDFTGKRPDDLARLMRPVRF